MSRYSRIFLRQTSNKFTDSWIESPSTVSTPQHQRTLSQGHSYPSTSSPRSPDTASPNKSPPPHPYTLGATQSPTPTAGAFDKERVVENEDTERNGQAQSKKQESVQAVGHQERLPRPRSSRRMSVAVTLPLPEPLRLGPLSIFLLYLPLPPLLSMIYMVCGHAILRRVHHSPASIYNAPIVTSLEAGATGGIIIAIPLAVILYLLLVFPTRTSTAPEDFFEDDTSSSITRQRWMHNLGICVTALFGICVGGPAGPLGVACLSHGDLGVFVRAHRILSPSSAAAAGFLGGGVIGLGLFIFCTGWFMVHMRWRRVS